MNTKEQKAAILKGCEDRPECWRVKAADKNGYARGISEVVTAVCDAIGTTPAACAKCPLNHDGECGEKGKYDNTYSYDERDKQKKEARK